MYVENYNAMRNALKAGFVMTKKDLFRGHYDLINVEVNCICLWWDELSGILMAIEL